MWLVTVITVLLEKVVFIGVIMDSHEAFDVASRWNAYMNILGVDVHIDVDMTGPA